MKQILLVARREFITQVRNKTFIIMTFLTPFIMLLIGGLIFWMNQANTDQKSIAIVDESEQFESVFKSNDEYVYSWHSTEEIPALKDSLVNNDDWDALLVIPKDTGRLEKIEKGIELFTAGSLGIQTTVSIEGKIENQIEKIRWKNQGISQETLESTKANTSIKIFNVKEGKEDRGAMVKLVLSAVLTYVIFMFIMIYGVRVMRSVVEEKNTRVVEIIISSLKPFNLMLGKILGTSGTALVQFVIWIGGTVAITGIMSSVLSSRMSNKIPSEALEKSSEISSKFLEISDILFELNYPLIIFVFLIFFVLGYLFYSAIFAAIGSAVDTDTDTQQFTFIPIFPLMIATYGSYFSVLQNPDGPVAFWLSMIPLTSPIAMVTRIPFEVVWWEIALSLSILAVSTWLVIMGAAKIYRVGILMYGKKASFKELFKWLRYS